MDAVLLSLPGTRSLCVVDGCGLGWREPRTLKFMIKEKRRPKLFKPDR